MTGAMLDDWRVVTLHGQMPREHPDVLLTGACAHAQ